MAHKFDADKNQFIAVNKNELLEDIVDARLGDIEMFYDELEDEMDIKLKDIINKAKDQIENDPNYRNVKKQDIKLIMYNNRSKVNVQKNFEDNKEIEV